MNIQIFGTKKCFDTKKVERFFKERRIKYQFIDLKEKGMSKGELNSVKASVPINELINEKSKNYKTSNITNVRSTDIKIEMLFKDQTLIKTPVVRNGKKAVVGFKTEVFEEWINND